MELASARSACSLAGNGRSAPNRRRCPAPVLASVWGWSMPHMRLLSSLAHRESVSRMWHLLQCEESRGRLVQRNCLEGNCVTRMPPGEETPSEESAMRLLLRICLSVLPLLSSACDSRAGRQQAGGGAAQSEAERTQAQVERYDAQLKKGDEQMAKAEAQAKRCDALLSKQEEQAARWDRILERWEKVLDRMEHTGPATSTTASSSAEARNHRAPPSE